MRCEGFVEFVVVLMCVWGIGIRSIKYDYNSEGTRRLNYV